LLPILHLEIWQPEDEEQKAEDKKAEGRRLRQLIREPFLARLPCDQ
jgi:hypothetical protein